MKLKLLILASLLILNSLCLTEDNKVQYKVSNLDSSLHDILWCGEGNDQAVIVQTELGTIYRSADKGMTWKKLADQFQKSGYVEIEKGEKVGVVQRILQSPVDKKLLIFIGTHGINWVSKDCGQNVQAMNQGRKVQDFQFHPTERNWLLAVAWTKCDDFEDEPCQIFKELFVSFDLGENWKLIEDYVVQFSWATLDETFLGKVPKERIILAHEPYGVGHQKIAGWSEKVHVSYSDDFFKTTKTLQKFGNKFLITPKYLFVATVVNEETQDVQLKVTDPHQGTYNFTDVQLPMKRLKDHSYTILDSSEGQVFLHVNHHGPKAKYGNIYISDSTGQRYSLSLAYNVRSLDGQCDFEKMQSLEGIYLANKYDETRVKLENDDENNGVIPVERTSRKEKQKAQSRYDDLDNYKQTKITFDKGGMWKNLMAPMKDSRGKKISCPDDGCSLHLNSITNLRFGPFYSTEKAVGLIIGTGNVGYHLATRADEINTYLSRDGGLTWAEIAKGSHIYEMGDHGGLIVLAPDQAATDTILYTWDEGLTFQSFKFSQNPIEITNIIIEPTSTSVQFVIYGEDNGKGVVVGLDFSSLHQRNCQGINEPNSETSDYENWSPNGEISPKCLMGHRITYTRRKQESQCFNTEVFERKTFVEHCECTEENWECDLGFKRSKEGSSCVSVTNKQELDYNPPEKCVDYYYVSQGYRKVAGDTCVGGVDHAPLKIPCPGTRTLTKTNISVLIIIGLIIAIILLSGSNHALVIKAKEIIYQILSIFSKDEKTLPFQYQQYKEGEDETGFSSMVFENNDNDDQAQPIENHNLHLQKGQKHSNNNNKGLMDDSDEESNELNDFNPRK